MVRKSSTVISFFRGSELLKRLFIAETVHHPCLRAGQKMAIDRQPNESTGKGLGGRTSIPQSFDAIFVKIVLVDDASMTSNENAGDLFEVAVLYGFFHFAKALYGKSFLSRIGCGESIASFLCESENLKKHDRERHISGDGECTASHGKVPFRVWSLGRVTAERL
jgi:hypothetical protein